MEAFQNPWKKFLKDRRLSLRNACICWDSRNPLGSFCLVIPEIKVAQLLNQVIYLDRKQRVKNILTDEYRIYRRKINMILVNTEKRENNKHSGIIIFKIQLRSFYNGSWKRNSLIFNNMEGRKIFIYYKYNIHNTI